MSNPNCGTWIKAELDDEGKLVVSVFACVPSTQRLPDGTTVESTTTREEDITNHLPQEVRDSIHRGLLAALSPEVKAAITDMALLDAKEMEVSLLKSNDPRVKKLALTGALGLEGKTEQNKG